VPGGEVEVELGVGRIVRDRKRRTLLAAVAARLRDGGETRTRDEDGEDDMAGGGIDGDGRVDGLRVLIASLVTGSGE